MDLDEFRLLAEELRQDNEVKRLFLEPSSEKRAVYQRMVSVVAEAQDLVARYPDPTKAPRDIALRIHLVGRQLDTMRDDLICVGLLHPKE